MDQEVREAVLNIANDVFYALIDKREGTVKEWHDEIEPFQNPVYAWVDSQGDKQLRVMLEMEDSTAKDLTRALFLLVETDEVTEEIPETLSFHRLERKNRYNQNRLLLT